MLQLICNSLETGDAKRFIVSTGFSTKEEIIDYLTSENAFNIVLPMEVLSEVMGDVRCTNHIVAYLDEDMILLNPDDVCFIEAALRKTKIHTEKATYNSNKPLIYYEKKLIQSYFFRSHKSFIINLKKVERCVQLVNYNYEVVFKDIKERAEISKSKIKAFKEKIEL